MKRNTLAIILCLSCLNLFSQTRWYDGTETYDKGRKALTLGILQGGGGIVGADFEYLLTDKVGMQLGVGVISYGGGINYHFKPSIRSSYMSISYWNQGLGELFSQNMVGLSYVYRSKKWFTAQIGIAKTITEGPNYISVIPDADFPPVVLVYSIGGYIPF